MIIHEEKNKEKKFIEESHWKIRVVVAFVLRWIFWDYVRGFSLSLSLCSISIHEEDTDDKWKNYSAPIIFGEGEGGGRL